MAGSNLASEAIDVGIVTSNGLLMLDFYENILGLKKEGEIPFEGLGIVNKFIIGSGYIKVLVLEDKAKFENKIGDFKTVSGIRYLTIHLLNLNDFITNCLSNAVFVATEPIEIRPGVNVAVINDPDGNMIELMQS